MQKDELENKIEVFVNFFVKFIRSIIYIFFPKLFIKTVENNSNVMTSPLTFLSIFSFGLMKLWKYYLLMFAIGIKGCSITVNNMAPTRTTVPEFSFAQSLGIPSVEEILLLSIPFVLLSLLLSKLFTKLASRLNLKYKIDTKTLYIYICSILVVIYSISFILGLESFIILIPTLAYIFYILLFSSKKSQTASKIKVYLACASFAILIPVAQIGGIYLIMGNYYKIVPLKADIDQYLPKDLFEAKLISHENIQSESFLKVLLKSNENRATEYYFIPKISHNIYGLDSLLIGEVINIAYGSPIRPDQCVILDMKCRLKDPTVKLDHSYFSFNVINTTDLKESKILTKVTSANNIYAK